MTGYFFYIMLPTIIWWGGVQLFNPVLVSQKKYHRNCFGSILRRWCNHCKTVSRRLKFDFAINWFLLHSYIDQGKNPQLFTKDCMEKALAKNEAVKGKIDSLKVGF